MSFQTEIDKCNKGTVARAWLVSWLTDQFLKVRSRETVATNLIGDPVPEIFVPDNPDIIREALVNRKYFKRWNNQKGVFIVNVKQLKRYQASPELFIKDMKRILRRAQNERLCKTKGD